jgi:hypothetical protein
MLGRHLAEPLPELPRAARVEAALRRHPDRADPLPAGSAALAAKQRLRGGAAFRVHRAGRRPLGRGQLHHRALDAYHVLGLLRVLSAGRHGGADHHGEQGHGDDEETAHGWNDRRRPGAS